MDLEEAVRGKHLRDFFEVDYRHVVYATLGALVKEGKIKETVLEKAKKDLEIKPDKLNPIDILANSAKSLHSLREPVSRRARREKSTQRSQ